MKNLLSLFLFCFVMKSACATVMDISKAKAQSPYIMQGGSFSTFGDLPALCDSVIHLGSPLMDNLRCVVMENNTLYRSLGGVWIPQYFVYKGDTATFVATKSNLTGKQDLLVSGTNIKTVNGTSLLGSGNVATTSGTVTSAGLISTDFSVSGSPITTSGNITANLNTLGTAGSYNATITTDNKGRVSVARNKTESTATRTLGTAFQISSTYGADVNYSVEVTVTSVLLGNAKGTVELQICPTISGTYVTKSISGFGVTGVVSSTSNTQTVGAYVPAGYYAKILFTPTTTGIGSSAAGVFQTGQETIY